MRKIKLADAIQALAVEQIVGDKNMQTELESNCSQGLENFIDAINSDGIEEDVQEHVWTRWMTTVKASIMVADMVIGLRSTPF